MIEADDENANASDGTDLKTIKRRTTVVMLIVGLLFFAYGLADTWRVVKQHESVGNFTAAASAWNHFIYPCIGALVGIGLALLLRWLFLRLIRRARIKKI